MTDKRRCDCLCEQRWCDCHLAKQDAARTALPRLMDENERLRGALEETADCLDDVARGRGGWDWETVVSEARDTLAARKEDGNG